MNNSTAAAPRIYFLDYLRALAVLLVVWAHLFLVGINDYKTVGLWVPTVKDFIFGPNSVAENVHGKFGLWLILSTGIGSGPLGVAIFFLISGFVILKTVDTTPPVAFLVKRFFRLIPLCAVVVLGTALLTVFFCSIYGIPQPNSITGVLTSMVAMNYFNGSFPTTPVLWTLAVEIWFYLIIALAVGVAGRLEFKSLFFLSLLGLLYIAALNTNPGFRTSAPIAWDRLIYFGSIFVHVNFMLVGSVIYRGVSTNKPKTALWLSLAVFLVYLISFKLFEIASDKRNLGISIADALTAWVIFMAAFWANLKRGKLGVFQWIGKISYPLYLVHVPLGWAIMAWLGSRGWNMNAAAFTSVGVVVLLSWALHHAVELPTQKLGRFVTDYLGLKSASKPQLKMASKA